jgi:hypothetical protein
MTVRPLAGSGFARHVSANDALFPNHERHKSGDAAKWMPDPAVFERSRPRGGRYAWLKVVAAG